ncbi:MAG: OB-fold nucleic acid binding domain-containing protein [Candidatus Nanoarchaeia archaeon]
MKISELKPNQGKVDIELEVISIDNEKEIDKFGKQLRLKEATAKDDSGQIKITFWNEDADKVKEGQKIKISNGYVKEFQGELQLSAGKFGKLEFLDGQDGEEEGDTSKQEDAEQEESVL